ncbi:MAG: SLC13 family permease, partial [Pseudomonadota bacterium]|nr:SLC13 family permease [Pseudomonadota bacterium]
MDTALTLTTDMKLVLGLVGFTMAMFLFERIRADVVALVVLLLLGLSGLVPPAQLFNGFSSNAVMA